MSPTFTASAPAKVNLLLRCGQPDEKGYHQLFTVFHSLNLRETVSLTPREDGKITVTNQPADLSQSAITCPPELDELPAEKHLAVRAVKLIQDTYGIKTGADLVVTKAVPVAGGMAGGSADAAAALWAAKHAFGLSVPKVELLPLARQLGADVPACLLGEILLGTGYGDHLKLLGPVPQRYWVMATNQTGLSTPLVFQQADRHPEQLAAELPTEISEAELKLLQGTDSSDTWTDFLELLENDLTLPALELRPDLAAPLAGVNALKDVDQQPLTRAILSGSGPTLAAPALDLPSAQKIAQTFQTYPGIERCYILQGPVPGAQLH
ncbi:hypothetical protein BSR28_07285 [Boudabousia liubingyangii]|uniref:GHMP family kinase ATP-binding protein n=1 Tax=Boudabousia liubingyangii TaxID=1921764 RepID=UPI00093D2368|nr:hypothetical protein [Boudabousia liubingyangii]OKL46332.1 hypothetical protein BSR28_07285 [Boudabousia liubingyangii]